MLGVALALGANTPLYVVLYHVVPGLDLARVPARWMLPAVLAFAVLAGVGAERWSPRLPRVDGAVTRGARAATQRVSAQAASYPGRWRWPLARCSSCGAGPAHCLAAALPTAPLHGHGATSAPALARLLVVAVSLGCGRLGAAQLPRPAGPALLLLVTVADLWSANGSLVQPLDPAPYYRGAAVDLAQASAGAGRVWALDRSVPLRLGMLDRRTRDVQDFAPLTLADYWLFTHPGDTLHGVDTGMARAIIGRYNERIADLLGVSLLIAPQPLHDRGPRRVGTPARAALGRAQRRLVASGTAPRPGLRVPRDAIACRSRCRSIHRARRRAASRSPPSSPPASTRGVSPCSTGQRANLLPPAHPRSGAPCCSPQRGGPVCWGRA